MGASSTGRLDQGHAAARHGDADAAGVGDDVGDHLLHGRRVAHQHDHVGFLVHQFGQPLAEASLVAGRQQAGGLLDAEGPQSWAMMAAVSAA